MAAACIICQDPLVLDISSPSASDSGSPGPSSSDPKTIPDDVTLACGDHFHWTCLLDAYTSPACPACHADVSALSSSGVPQVLVTLTNEGGVQDGLDILPLLAEEAHLREYPEQRIARAYMELCREGDVEAIVDLLRAADPEEGLDAAEILRYQDPLAGGASGLHAAVEAGKEEVVWLLLLLASELSELEFPALVYQEAAALGVMRGPATAGVDIRGLRDERGRTAEDVAREVGGVWSGWVGSGRLAV